MSFSKYSQYTTAVGYDCSASTGFSQSANYHLQTQQIVKDLNSETTLFIRWDDTYKIISKVDLEEINKNKRGFGGTSPHTLFQFLKDIGFKGDLIFISDGQISPDSALVCSKLLMIWKFNKVYVNLISTGGIINESVSCALTRNSPHEIKIYKNLHSDIPTDSISVNNEDFNFVFNIDSINSIEEFLTQKEPIKNVLFSVNSGIEGNKILHKKLVELKNKLIKSESKSFSKNADNPISRLIESFNRQNLSPIELDNVWKMYYKIEDDDTNDWKKLIDKFISWCSGDLIYSFDRNKISNREASAVKEPVIPSESVAILEEKFDDLKLTCPITLSDTSSMILLMKKNGSSVFDNLPTNIRDSLINCPLNALRNKGILNYIRSLMDCAISIEAYKDLVEYGMSDKSPLTRNQIFGGLCLGKDKSHIQATNSTLRYILTGGKSLGNIDMWFVVIYFIIKRESDDYYLKDYLPMIEEHLKYRLMNSKSYMCLSGLPTYPTYQVPLGLALWCSVMATTSNLSLITDAKNDPIRLHLSYSNDIIDLLNIINIHVPSKLINHINRLKTLRYFLLEVKKGKTETLKLKNLVDALSYNAIETLDLWVLIDGEPSDLQISNVRSKFPIVCQDLSNTEIKDILELCDSNKTEADIYLPYNYDIKPFRKTITKNWKFGNKVPYFKVNISPKTCRPYYNIIDNGQKKIWIDKASEIYGDTLFSTNEFFGTYVLENKKYPTKSEFFNYLFTYYFSRNTKTLPICVEQFVNEVFNEYQEILDTINPEIFVERWKSSVCKDIRKKMEL